MGCGVAVSFDVMEVPELRKHGGEVETVRKDAGNGARPGRTLQPDEFVRYQIRNLKGSTLAKIRRLALECSEVFGEKYTQEAVVNWLLELGIPEAEGILADQKAQRIDEPSEAVRALQSGLDEASQVIQEHLESPHPVMDLLER